MRYKVSKLRDCNSCVATAVEKFPLSQCIQAGEGCILCILTHWRWFIAALSKTIYATRNNTPLPRITKLYWYVNLLANKHIVQFRFEDEITP
jgi:hypothetical protein